MTQFLQIQVGHPIFLMALQRGDQGSCEPALRTLPSGELLCSRHEKSPGRGIPGWRALLGAWPDHEVGIFGDPAKQQLLQNRRGTRQPAGLCSVCSTMPGCGGGGLYIQSGGLQQKGGSIELQSCHSKTHGGGLMIANGGLLQLAGNITCQNCSALSGGCLAVDGRTDPKRRGLHLSGSITAHSCTAGGQGHDAEHLTIYHLCVCREEDGHCINVWARVKTCVPTPAPAQRTSRPWCM